MSDKMSAEAVDSALTAGAVAKMPENRGGAMRNLRAHIAALVAEREAAVADFARLSANNTSLGAMYRAACSERDQIAGALSSAVADNAALYSGLRDASRGLSAPLILRIQFTLDQPHPGAALLEQHRKALEARDDANAGLLASLRSERDQHSEALAAAARRHETTRATMHIREGEHRKALVRARNEGLEKAAALVLAQLHVDPDEGLSSIRARIIAMKEPES